jgi:hypothetical protein
MGVRARVIVLLVAAAAALVGACTPAASPARPTDPRELLVRAVRATAALPTARLHAEMTTSMAVPNDVGGVPAGRNLDMAMAIDADVDLEHRALAGRQTSSFAGGAAGMFGAPNTTTEVIVAPGGLFLRQQGMAKWMSAGGGPEGGPTNAAVAEAIVALLSDTRVDVVRRDDVACSLGTCDDVGVHVPKEVLAGAAGALFGGPDDPTAAGAAGIPDLDLDVRIDQGSLVISEIRVEIAAAEATAKVLVVLSQPGEPVTIAAPPPGMVDDLSGGSVETILETVGDEVEPPTPMPADPEPSAP